MAMTASSLLARLEELKEWQARQQQRLLQQQKSRTESINESSSYDTIEGLSTLDTSVESTHKSHTEESPDLSRSVENALHSAENLLQTTPKVNRENSPKMRQILEEKNSNKFIAPEYIRVDNPNKPKRPFLKRGAGLARFKMNLGDQQRHFSKGVMKNKRHNKVRFEDDIKGKNCLSPLKLSDELNLKAVWRGVENSNEVSEEVIVRETISQINEIAAKRETFPEVNLHRNQKVAQTNNYVEEEDEILDETNDLLIRRKLCFGQNAKKVDDVYLLQEMEFQSYECYKDININYKPKTIERTSDVKCKIDEIPLRESEGFETEQNKQERSEYLQETNQCSPITKEYQQKTNFEMLDEEQRDNNNRNQQRSINMVQNQCEENHQEMKKARQEIFVDTNECQPEINLPSEQSLYERNLEKELLIFEALEEKALNSSFSSTNSSILRILSSTPNKIKELKNIKPSNFQNCNKNQGKIKEIINKPIIEEEDGIEAIDCRDCIDSSVTSEDTDDKTLENEKFCNEKNSCDQTDACTDGASSLNTSFSSESSIGLKHEHVSKGVNTENFTAMNGEHGTSTVHYRDEVLARKLKELDEEIQNFRIESSKLQRKRTEVEKQDKMFKKEKKEFQKYVLEEKIKVEFYLEEEKKKFAKEKLIFDKYVKEMQNKTNRKEREEISALKEEIANLKEAAKLKETRNATSQARLRNQMKSYEKEINNLKEELEKLRKQNAKLTAAQKLSKKSTDAKMLQEINKNLSKLTKDVTVQDKLKKIDDIIAKENKPPELSLIKGNNEKKSPEKESARKKNNFDSLLELGNLDERKDYEKFLKEKSKIIIESPKSLQKENDINNLTDENLVKTYQEFFRTEEEYNKREEIRFNKTKSLECTNKAVNDTSETTLNDSKMSKLETSLPDGSKEIKYSNGNFKSISPDGNFIRMKYFNGDLKETKLLEGVIKYYYAESQSWHTTLPDSTEILEFPDGQIETKHKNGTYEVKLPNGTVKVTNSDKSETIAYPDGTKVQIIRNGDKIIELTNGQREIHTTEHMRREYPDGTVKILYPDGIQETRYYNGRIRIKDKNGKLLLDSHEEAA